MAPTASTSTAGGMGEPTPTPIPAPMARNRTILDVFFFASFAVIACILVMMINRRRVQLRKASPSVNLSTRSVVTMVEPTPQSPASTLVEDAPQIDERRFSVTRADRSRPRARTMTLRRSSKQLHRLRSHLSGGGEEGFVESPNEVIITSSSSTSLYRHRHRAGHTTATFLLAVHELGNDASSSPSTIRLDDVKIPLSPHTEEPDTRGPIIQDRDNPSTEELLYPPLKRPSFTSPLRRESFTHHAKFGEVANSLSNQQLLLTTGDSSETALKNVPGEPASSVQSAQHVKTKSYGEMLAALALETLTVKQVDGTDEVDEKEQWRRRQSQAEFKAFSEEFGKQFRTLSWCLPNTSPIMSGKSLVFEEVSSTIISPTRSARLSARALIQGVDELQRQMQREEHNRRI
ncbi:hypothetical protein FRB94_013215 [Tulasnella sp. JGI-2019a]|nr:hypothetical protein FRB93_011791 [Tulasnella sp. JGI-2019a]KAG9008491.1 hypothetical protein FRB94_013215 [Tulasnella sp. JGI-2019a]KAG9034771.1 hypothetical protein FRB95_012592 [Tulasnella sp. JGI-2019a]